ncbi:hypothetical protein LJR186_001216 [Microbacterium foliorum]
MTRRYRRAGWLALVGAVVLTLILAPSRETPPALPEPGARTIVARAFGDTTPDV